MGVDHNAVFGYGTPIEPNTYEYLENICEQIYKETNVQLEFVYNSYENFADWFVYVDDISIFGGGKMSQATPVGNLVLSLTDSQRKAIELFNEMTKLKTDWGWNLYTFMS